MASDGAKDKDQDKPTYIGRFAPSPTGPLHAGSLVAALASWLDARAHHGRWLVRIEDVDTPRCQPGAHRFILQQLAACGLEPDEAPLYQSQRGPAYQAALDQLLARHLAYPCACSRKDVAQALASAGRARPRDGELIYPGSCRNGLHGRSARAWRFNTQHQASNRSFDHIERAQLAIDFIATDATSLILWQDRLLGPQRQDVASEVGDFVLKRADGLWAYQLAVVADDAAQGITDVVRGADLADNTARQILLQRALGLPALRYLHTPLVLGAHGQKLSKQNGAQALDTSNPLKALAEAGRVLGLNSLQSATAPGEWLAQALPEWTARYAAC